MSFPENLTNLFPIPHPKTPGEKTMAIGFAGNIGLYGSILVYNLFSGMLPEGIGPEIIEPKLSWALTGPPSLIFNSALLGGYVKSVFLEKDSWFRRERSVQKPFLTIQLDSPIEVPLLPRGIVDEVPLVKNRLAQQLLLSRRCCSVLANAVVSLTQKDNMHSMQSWVKIAEATPATVKKELGLILYLTGQINRDFYLGKIAGQISDINTTSDSLFL